MWRENCWAGKKSRRQTGGRVFAQRRGWGIEMRILKSLLFP
jgi:hypothetical protein